MFGAFKELINTNLYQALMYFQGMNIYYVLCKVSCLVYFKNEQILNMYQAFMYFHGMNKYYLFCKVSCLVYFKNK